MLKGQRGASDDQTQLRLRRVAFFVFAVLACTTLLQAIIFFGVAGVPIKPDAVFLISAPLLIAVATLVLARPR
jgi:hypothetical protein